MTPGLHLELLDRFTSRDRIEQVWKDLSETSECSYFLSWGWVQNWIETLPKDASVQLAILAEGTAPRCAFFLGSANLVKRGAGRGKAYLLNQTGNWDYDRLHIEHNSVLQSGENPCSLQQILDNLPGDWEELYLSALASTGSLADDLRAAPPYEVTIANRMPAPYVDLEVVRQTPGGHLALLPSNVRGQVKRANRLYEAQGELLCEVARTLPQALNIYEELIALNREWWRRRKQSSAFRTEYFRIFHRRLIENRFSTGEILLFRLRCGGKTIGCLYNFLYRGVVYFYQSGLAIEEDNRMKPGYICHMEAVRYCAKAGHAKYDFLAGVEGYKGRLATHQAEIVWARVQKPVMKFRVERLLHGAARSMKAAHGA